jgi:hypothetical protein
MIRILCLALALAGCALPDHTIVERVASPPVVETRVVYKTDVQPAQKCLPAPVTPGNLNNHNMGDYIAALIIAGDDCRTKLERSGD